MTVNPSVLRARCRRMFPVLTLAVLGALLPGRAAAQALERDIFVSVLDRSGKPVPNLGPRDFAIREDGRLREVLRVRRATEPIDLAVLVDTSAAAGSQISDLRQGLESLVAQMRPHAHISLVEFGERPRVLADYTSDAALLAQGIGRVFSTPGSGAYTLEAVVETLNGLEKREAERSAILVIWLGGAEFSNRDDRNVLEQLADQGPALHVVTVSRGTPPDAMTADGRSRESVFDRGTRASGGSRQNLLSSMAIKDTLDRIAAELLSQYRVTYARPQTLIPPEKIEVSATRTDLTARGTPVRVKANPPK
jgi:Ca-activated chloride channel family protein